MVSFRRQSLRSPSVISCFFFRRHSTAIGVVGLATAHTFTDTKMTSLLSKTGLLHMTVEKQETLLKMAILTIAAILCEYQSEVWFWLVV